MEDIKLGELEFDDEQLSEDFDSLDMDTIVENESDEDGNGLEDEDYSDKEEDDYSDDFGADEDGTDVDLMEEGLLDEEEETYDVIGSSDNSFINGNGDIVVMDNDENGENFEIKYIPIEDITVVKRIRKSKSVESLLQSIKSTGLLEPIVVAPLQTEGKFVLIAGYRRLLACARAGIRNVPSVVNKKVNTTEIPILEALYNHSDRYSMPEIVDYIDYLEKEKGIVSASMIEYLLQLDNGDYAKLKDVLEDDDDEIVSKLMDGQISIAQAFKNLENRRKKESKEEKDLKKTSKVYADTEESGAEALKDSGESGEEEAALTDEEIKSLAINASDLNDVDDLSLDDMVAEGKDMSGFEDHKQKSGEREIIDPAIRKAVMSKNENTCQCCKRGGPDYVDILDLHHVVEVYLGGVDSVDNGIALCLNCHKQVHLYAFNKLHIPKSKTNDELELEVKTKILEENTKRENEHTSTLTKDEEQEIREGHFTIYREEQNKYKRIVKLGNVIRKGLQMKGMKLDKAKKEHPIEHIGRQMPGTKNTIA